MKIPRSVLDAVHRQLVDAYPSEGCGLLLGNPQDNGKHVVVRLHSVHNMRERDRAARNRYLISPADYRSAMMEARTLGLDVIGTYHSHPDAPARPSEYDREHAWPWYGYLITSLRDGVVRDNRVWRLTEDRGQFIEQMLEIEEA